MSSIDLTDSIFDFSLVLAPTGPDLDADLEIEQPDPVDEARKYLIDGHDPHAILRVDDFWAVVAGWPTAAISTRTLIGWMIHAKKMEYDENGDDFEDEDAVDALLGSRIESALADLPSCAGGPERMAAIDAAIAPDIPAIHIADPDCPRLRARKREEGKARLAKLKADQEMVATTAVH